MPMHQKLQAVGSLSGNGVAKTFSGGAGPREIKIYITGGAGVTVGAVQLEEAATPDYAGTWAAIGSPIAVTADTTKTVSVTGAFLAIRARISTTVDAGGVAVDLVGAQDHLA